MSAEAYHVPVMVAEVLRYLEPERGGLYFDGTVGGGGHSEAILRAAEAARVYGVDRDPEALEVAKRRLAGFDDRVTYRRGDYADAVARVSEPLAGALLDLGISSHQIDVSERGFSFREGSPLDMRMSRGGETAADVLNTRSERDLADIFYYYGEERRARGLARAVVRARATSPFRMSEDLVSVLERVLGPRITPQDKARIFQALRIEVNGELESLERGLEAIREALGPGGVFVVLAYHSLEDRAVKNAFRDWSKSCVCPPELPVCQCRGVPLGEVLTRRPVYPSADETEENTRSRSARLRAWRKAA
ncbi:MAG: 16S rRNA (cytosine(1402)-N(4))-methyltransferase RsmH [Gemmatimonadota bacterium]